MSHLVVHYIIKRQSKCRWVIINMIHQHSIGKHIVVPQFVASLHLLYQIALVRIHGVYYLVCLSSTFSSFQGYITRLGKLLYLSPTKSGTLPARQCRGTKAVIGVLTRVHKSVIAQSHITTLNGVGKKTCGIHIGKSETVAELMAEQSDAIQPWPILRFFALFSKQLVVHSISLDSLSVKSLRQTHLSRLRPDIIAVVRTIVFTISGIDDVYQVHLSVAVGIILREVYVFVGSTAGIRKQQCHVVVFSVGSKRAAHLIRSIEVKLWCELSKAHVGEILFHATEVIVCRLRASGQFLARVEIFLKLLLRIVNFKAKVAELHQDHKGLWRPCAWKQTVTARRACSLAAHVLHLHHLQHHAFAVLPVHGQAFHQSPFSGFVCQHSRRHYITICVLLSHIEPVAHHRQYRPVGGSIVMSIFVTM